MISYTMDPDDSITIVERACNETIGGAGIRSCGVGERRQELSEGFRRERGRLSGA